jgi:hypothetical protein
VAQKEELLSSKLKAVHSNCGTGKKKKKKRNLVRRKKKD